MHRLAFLCALTGFGLLSTHAHADEANLDWDGGYKQVATRRSGLILGLSTGVAFGNARGYPNELAKLDDRAFRRNVGAAVGSTTRLWIGGALTDWFVFGLGGAGLKLNGNNATGSGSEFLVHIEAYPLFYQGGVFRDLSLFGDFGAGGFKISGNNRQLADGGLMSVIGFGSGWDAVRFWRFTLGPQLEYVHSWSQSMQVNAGEVTVRVAFVGGP